MGGLELSGLFGVWAGVGVGVWAGVGDFGDGLGLGLGLVGGPGDGGGVVVSIEKVRELLASAPSLLRLPAASENLEEATEMTPSAVLSAVGVNVAE